jgi:hypothetical protein
MTHVILASEAVKKSFTIQAGDAVTTLKQFATQSDQQLIYSGMAVDGVKTSVVKGDFHRARGPRTNAAGSGLAITEDLQNGSLAVTRPKPQDSFYAESTIKQN